MRIDEAQREMRQVYLGGSVGAWVSATLWLIAAALGSLGSRQTAMLVIIFGGMLIFPSVLLALKLMGRPAFTSKANPLNSLAMQVAFTIPLSIPLILAATRGRAEWFFAGFLIVVGAHYLPFVTLYGQPVFYLLALIMVGAGFALPVLRPGDFAIGGYVGVVLFIVTGIYLAAHHAGESARRARITRSP